MLTETSADDGSCCWAKIRAPLLCYKLYFFIESEYLQQGLKRLQKDTKQSNETRKTKHGDTHEKTGSKSLPTKAAKPQSD